MSPLLIVSDSLTNESGLRCLISQESTIYDVVDPQKAKFESFGPRTVVFRGWWGLVADNGGVVELRRVGTGTEAPPAKEKILHNFT